MAEDAKPGRLYEWLCPGCGGRVSLRDGGNRRAHFAHRAGEGTPACDEYFPSIGGGGDSVARSLSEVEDDPSELGLLLTQLDGRWGLGLRLPEIPNDELGETSLGELRSAFVDIYAGRDQLLRVSALDLRPGVGAARVDVVPSLQAFQTQATGSWPALVAKERWLLASRGLEAKGTLFRLRRGEWTRLRNGAGVHEGEGLVVLGVSRPQAPITAEFRTRVFVGGDSCWTYWEVQLPTEPDANVLDWLHRLGHTVIPRPWSLDLATPPRALDENGAPSFWVTDAPLVALASPRRRESATVSLRSDASASSVGVTASELRDAIIAITSPQVGPANLTVAAERSAKLDVVFVARPPREVLFEQLLKTPRVRIWLGDVLIEAWKDSSKKVPIQPSLPEVRVDLGSESARACVTIWESGKRRTARGLDRRNAERVIAEALPVASRIELDADNFGRVELTPARVSSEGVSRATARDRMGWFDHVSSLATSPEQYTATTLLKHPRASTSLTVRRVGGPALVRGRLASRRRYEVGGKR
ncbi:competence protein CoiA family protein [Myxococcus qinghaiensis]|uniref:competence protein CoiA family protein n=1 Tax=Myxococcus qinghaiensis TaxID=2906758 RepID=UPI0020A75242|nr:hypothetical protein [Myxococcus qinghaiensis]